MPISNRKKANIRDVLSKREQEVVLLVVEGLSNKEIGRRLKLAEGTVKVHLHNVYQKMSVNSRKSLVFLLPSYSVSDSSLDV